MEFSKTLARQIIENNAQSEMDLFLPYNASTATKEEANEVERLIMSLYWSLNYYDRTMYGLPEFPTVKLGVIYYGNDIVARDPIGIMLLHSYPTGPENLWVSVAVRDDCRGQGLSSKMFKSLLDLIKEQYGPVPALYWASFPSNIHSIKLAKRLGFVHQPNVSTQDYVILKKKLSSKSESATKYNIRRKDKSDGVLYKGPCSLLVDKVKVYDNSGDIVLSGRVGDVPRHFSGSKFISSNINNSPMILDYLKKFQGHPNGLQLKVDDSEFKKQDSYNYLRINLSI